MEVALKEFLLRNPGAALETVPSPGPLWTRGGSCRGDVCEPGRPGEPGAQADARGSLLVLEQVDPGSLAQALGQLAGLLHQHVRGHNRQVEGQQLVAPDSLGRVALQLKEALVSLAYLNCQHHYSCALGPLLHKIMVT